MALITIETARAQVRADADEGDALIQFYLDAAEAACANACNRFLYADDDALQEAIDAIPAVMAAARIAYDDAMDAAALIEDERDRETAELIAAKALAVAETVQEKTINGMVATPDILAAILLTTTDFYVNREVGTIPKGAVYVCDSQRYPGPL